MLVATCASPTAVGSYRYRPFDVQLWLIGSARSRNNCYIVSLRINSSWSDTYQEEQYPKASDDTNRNPDGNPELGSWK